MNDENPYTEGTIVKSCDVKGEVVQEEDDCNEKTIILWETQQQYAYTREWLDQNVKVIT